MYNDPSSIEEAKKQLNDVSPTFCMAKWMHSSIHLHMGRTHSCYLPPTHKIPVKEILENPSALHNTTYKKAQRKMMLDGTRPQECKICWEIEDLPGGRYSDRHYRGQDSWIKPFYNIVKDSPWNKDIDPSYLEVSFSSVCNFKCSYCNPTFSTAWLKEVEEEGGYKLSNFAEYQSPFWLKAQGLMPIDDEHNPYVDAFWKWWPSLKENLMYFRVTGGEPLLSDSTFKLFGLIQNAPLPNLNLDLNSNLGIPEKQFVKFLSNIKSILEEKKVKHFMLHTSIDAYGSQAEYIRNGLNFKSFENYVERYLEELPGASLSFTCTYNALSVVGFNQLMEWVLSLRKRYTREGRNIFLDIPHLQSPHHQSCLVLPAEFKKYIRDSIEFMKSRENNVDGVKPAETLKMRRILEWIETNQPRNEQEEKEKIRNQKDFYLFFNEHDRRRNTDFKAAFPEMADFYNYCHLLSK